MTDHLPAHTLNAYARGTLAGAELLNADSHVSGCEECRNSVSTVSSRAARSWRVALAMESDLETCDVLERVVDERLGEADRDWLEEHISHCAACAAELGELTAIAPPSRWSIIGRWHLAGSRKAVLAFAAAAAAGGVIIGTLFTALPERVNAPVASPQGASRREIDAQAPRANVPSRTPTRPHVDSLAALPPELIPIADAIRAGRLPAGEALPGREYVRGTPPDGADEATILSPVAEVIEERRPTFRWSRARAESAVVQIFDHRYDPVLQSKIITGDEWRATRALERGETYSWQVVFHFPDRHEVVVPAPPAPQATFRILDDRTATAIEAAHRTGAHLEAGLRYAAAGMPENALAELTLASEAEPDSVGVRDLADSLRRQLAIRDGGRVATGSD